MPTQQISSFINDLSAPAQALPTRWGDGRFTQKNFFQFGITDTDNFSDLSNSQGLTVLIGQASDDTIYAETGSNVVLGGTGNDQLWGGDGNDFIGGGSGSDYLWGDNGDDLLLGWFGRGGDSGVEADNATNFGQGEVDILVGGAGNDWFVLGGGQNLSYYDDGDANSEGLDDYALIEDFENGDKILLSSRASRYVLDIIEGSLPAGVGIYEIAEPFRPIEPIFATGGTTSGATIASPFIVGGGDPNIARRELVGVVANADLSALSLTDNSQFVFL